MKQVKMSNLEIEKMGGVFVKYSEWEYNNHYGGYIRHKVYLLNEEEVISHNTWEFKGV
ncbi:hypothetical protein MVQ26_04940 [Fusobacterium necrophorum]|uniref:hypothetical protein n=1 Tax=Fusobacterium necrophorum TaxID=859 RepID=UPI000B2898E3|nr:hypothetical protein [Fusobacterium necrophorum]MDK4473779.1 hypothetical protein [Fusobacterium necrophorum]MDK4483005.1 hypothetical protein [Fusobacterium necrophorum]MDK4484276.1 hypothetical protein [Fusobacterium necrophorum]MDK4487992.1 hypothetical protein [Fusobacterium necrophorum]MDK4489591.1 hypothetical protein [Fusobacterium necrophorum]